MAIQVAGEGWIGDLLDWFPGPQWVQVYDRRSTTPIPVAVTPSGGTLPLLPDPAGVQVPSVVPGPGPTFNNTQPPPLVLTGDLQLPTGGVAEGEDEVALEDWFQTAIDLGNTIGRLRSPVYPAPAQYVGGTPLPSSTPGTDMAVGNGAMPKGMYVDSHGHLVHRRRRRRPCITQTDLSLAWQISNLPNNANVKMFLAKCVK